MGLLRVCCEFYRKVLRLGKVFKLRRLRVVENMMRIFGPKRDEVTGEWRKLHNEKLNDLYSSPNIVRLIKSRRTRYARHVARMGREEAYTSCKPVKILKKDAAPWRKYGIQANSRLQQTNDLVNCARSESQPRALGSWQGVVKLF
jgi:hypothetical protein